MTTGRINQIAIHVLGGFLFTIKAWYTTFHAPKAYSSASALCREAKQTDAHTIQRCV